MASIPLPALSVRAPEQPDVLQKFGQILALKNAAQQVQLQQQEAPLRLQALQQQAQAGQINLEQGQEQQRNQQAITAAYHKWDGKDYNQLAKLALESGANGEAVQKIQQHALDIKEKYSQIAKDDAATGASNITTLMKKNDVVSGALSTVLQTPDDQLPQALTTTAAQLAQQGLLDPQHVQMAQQIAQSGNPAQIRTQLDLMRKGMLSDSQLLEQASKQSLMERQKVETEQAAANADETKRYHNVEAKQGQQRISAEYARLQFDRQKQGTQDASAIESQAQQIAGGDVKPLSQSRNNPYSRAVMARAYEINPDLSDQLYATKQDFLSSKGKANAQVQSLNKLSAHLGELQSASDKAGFSPVGFTAAGKDLRLAEQLFSKEDVKFLSGSGIGTEGELNGLIEKTHSPVQSVRDSAINTLSRFTADAARQIGDQYERGTKQKFDPNQHFTPTTVQMMQKSGGTSARESNSPASSGTIRARDAQGKLHEAPAGTPLPAGWKAE